MRRHVYVYTKNSILQLIFGWHRSHISHEWKDNMRRAGDACFPHTSTNKQKCYFFLKKKNSGPSLSLPCYISKKTEKDTLKDLLLNMLSCVRIEETALSSATILQAAGKPQRPDKRCSNAKKRKERETLRSRGRCRWWRR